MRRSANRLGATIVALFVASGVGLARGQEGGVEDEEDLYRPQRELVAPAELRREKRRAARANEHWVGTGIAMFSTGFDSNLHQSPNDRRRSSAVGQAGVKLEALRYLGENQRLKLSFSAYGLGHTQDSDVNEEVEQLRLFYGLRVGSRISFSLRAKAKRQSDSVTTIAGDSLRRDFGYVSYYLTPTVRLRLSENQQLVLSYSMRRKDYNETATLESLDSWKHGVRLGYEITLAERWEAGLSYSWSRLAYDEETAALSSGFEFSSNPKEKHYFHRAAVALQWEPRKKLQFELGYRLTRKDDRFQDYESYSANAVKLGALWKPDPRWQLAAELSFAARSYDERPSSRGADLEYARFAGQVGVRRLLSRNVWLFARYAYGTRDTNREEPATTYRDYTRHQLVVGVVLAR